MDRKRHSATIKGLVTAGTFLAVLLALTSAPLSEARAADKLAIDSVQGADLPIGASGQRAITVCGGGSDCGGATGPVIIGSAPPNAVPQATLDVNGTLHLAPAAEGDNCSSLGAQAYNGTTGAPLYCGSSDGKVLTWRLVGSEASAGTLCGLVTWFSLSDGTINKDKDNKVVSTFPCNGKLIASANATWWPGEAAPFTCPSGYSSATASIGSDAFLNTVGADGDSRFGFFYYTTCIKD
ncbi:MAG: hypothetical protein PHS57_08325 [Alphaproteobacteria bacterium]|nr:hypothetical protein [Alphaproteobacteria bacterium]